MSDQEAIASHSEAAKARLAVELERDTLLIKASICDGLRISYQKRSELYRLVIKGLEAKLSAEPMESVSIPSYQDSESDWLKENSDVQSKFLESRMHAGQDLLNDLATAAQA